MQGSARRRSFTRNGVVAGSVWEARMRVDAVNGGIKVFNGDESRDGDGDGNADEEGMRVYRRLRRNQSDSIAAGRRRRIWTPPPSSASSVNGSIGGNPIPLHKARSELAEDSRELGGVGRVLAIGDGSEGVGGDDGDVEIEDVVGRESFDDKEMDLPVERGKNVEEEKTITQVHEIPASSPPVVEKKQDCPEIATSPVAEKQQQQQQQSQRAIDPDPIKPPPCNFLSNTGKFMSLWQLAVLLFAMARCGNSITIWTLSRLLFFGVFTVPKICSSYSTQLAKHGNFWVERIRDGWESCTHKKAVAAAVFTLIWNISSTVARIWAGKAPPLTTPSPVIAS
ncbi:hypothetical protein B296_00023779 [Ensete ventricosum]|uniref:Reticulon domain-containing protein n=1 Tax=Ensete ventricosum TaxID=4639 RepID=A0A426Z161_ENSVE|nr:hypothetical protein B296_00023779 [Ensete ventricosum]